MTFAKKSFINSNNISRLPNLYPNLFKPGFIYFVFILLLTNNLNLTAQTCITKKTAPKQALKQYNIGRDYYVSYNFEKAAKAFRKAIKIEPDFIDAHIYLGGVYQDMNKNASAKKEYEKAIQLDSNYNVKLYYTIGLLEIRSKKYTDAIIHLEKYISNPDAKEALIKKAKVQLQKANFIIYSLANPVPFNPVSLGDSINTKKGSEYLPSLSADQQKLVFTRKIYNQEDFFISTKKNNKWQKAKPIKELNTPGNEGAFCLSPDGNTIIFTLCDRKENFGTCDLYTAELKNGKWSNTKNMGKVINSKAWDTQPCLSPDNNVLYFVSNRKGYGGSDIWISKRKNGKWTKPFNAGKKINTSKDEQSPFLHEDGKTLFFSSKGHIGLGNFDIFRTVLDENQHWSEVINLGYPINTEGSESALIVALDGKTAYYSNAKINGSTRNDMDLYEFELPPSVRATPSTFVRGIVRDSKTKERIQANIKIGIKNSKRIIEVNTDKNGEFLVCLPLGDNYFFNVLNNKYIFYSENFKLNEIKSNIEPIEKDIYLKKLESISSIAIEETDEKPMILKNVFFNSGEFKLKPESTFELDNLVLLLNEHTEISIQIIGHTDNVGNPKSNQVLSEKRAESVVNYLVNHGINKNRLSYIGYGETQPISTNDTNEGRSENRRTEFIIK